MGVRTKVKTAREMCGMKQIDLAYMIPMSEGNLRRIENGQQRCEPDIAKRIAEITGKPWVADPTIPEDYVPLRRSDAMLRYLNEKGDVEAVTKREMAILADGRIDESEAADHAAYIHEVSEECTAARDLIYAEG
jgi:DNA-binding XRE family transcriptional regulator